MEKRFAEELLPTLIKNREENKVLSPQVKEKISHELGLLPIRVEEVSSFYPILNQPPAKFTITCCKSLSCFLENSKNMERRSVAQILQEGALTGDTTIHFKMVSCLGLCNEAPAMLINDHVITNMTPEKAERLIQFCREN